MPNRLARARRRALPRARAVMFAGLAFAEVAFASASARALEPEITSETSAQFYEIRSPSGETVIARRRLVTTLGVATYDLLGADKAQDPDAPTLSFRARMRYDADYGGAAAETNVSSFGRLVPGFDRGPIDVMYGYVEGRRFLNGWLGFRLGRQYVTDALGWWSFDGGRVKVTTPYYVAAEVYGGFEQRGGMPLSTARFGRDGVFRGDRDGYDPSLYPSFQPAGLAPAFGAALESTGFTSLHGRLTYRRVYNTGTSNVSQFANGLRQPVTYDGARISQERVGYAMDGSIAKVGGVKAGVVYDVYRAKASNLYASIDGYVSRRVTVGADYDYYVPTFDGDSIWNFFLAMPMNDLTLRASWEATSHVSLSAGTRGRLFMQQTGPEDTSLPSSPNGLAQDNVYPSRAAEPMIGGNLGARYHFGEGSIAARGAADFQSTGERLGLDLYGQRTLQTRFIFQARTGLWQWNDRLRPDRDAVSFQYVLGLGYKLFPRSTALAQFEHDINRIAGQRFRVMLYLTLATTK